MPTYPSNAKCSTLSCNNIRSKLNSFCAEHGGKNYTHKETDSVYQTPAWRTLRQRQLSIQPLCQSCLTRGRVDAAKHVDHVFPWKQIGKHAFLNNVFQSLCPPCHSHKTAQEQKGIYEHYTQDGVKEYTEHDYPTHAGK